ncbi:MAG: hypothetical protein L6Q98_14065 [Anaerolineae bacterium]|nr:hypothetical protein [Anaerolineae bacterium]NUQ03346.1 hypothetical protein [Anaerolineae bacterium]
MTLRKIGLGLAVLLIIGGASATLGQEATSEATPEAAPETTGAVSEATPEATEAPPPPGAMRDFPGPGTFTVTVMQGEVERNYGVYIPEGYADAAAPVPLLIVLHAANGSGVLAEAHTGFTDLADEFGFVVAYPDGINGFWNDGRPLDSRVNLDISDSAYIAGVITFLSSRLSIDRARVFAAGYSMGGMMALRAGCELNGMIAGVASVASTMPQYATPFCQDSAPLSVLFMIGTDDRAIPWSGLSRQGDGYLSAAESLIYWGEHNACTDDAPPEAQPDAAPEDGTLVILNRHTACADETAVLLYGILFGGHTWPGRPNPIGIDSGVVSGEFDGSRVIWEFFSGIGGD